MAKKDSITIQSKDQKWNITQLTFYDLAEHKLGLNHVQINSKEK